jgi:hypothetical protein
MHQVSGTRFDIRSGIQQDEAMAGSGDDGGDADALDAVDGAQADGGGSDEAARIAGGDEGVGFLLAEQFDGL